MKADLGEKIKNYIEKMPSLPTSVSKVLEICNKLDTSPADLNHVISLDPVLAGRVIKLINSAYYGMGQPVASLTRAIIMLGINTVKNLALSTAVMGNLSSEQASSGLDMEGFWRHSLCVGVSAKLLAKKRGINTNMLEEYFTAGLLHDIGKIPLNVLLSKEYLLTVSAADKAGESLFRMETDNLGLNHCTSGALISAAWKLDGAVGDTIAHHHTYDIYSGEYKDVLYSVAAANRFASLVGIGFSGDRCPSPLPAELWEYLDISGEILNDIEDEVNKAIEKAEIFLRIDQL